MLVLSYRYLNIALSALAILAFRCPLHHVSARKFKYCPCLGAMCIRQALTIYTEFIMLFV